ncbi:MAG: nitronate monooxygenase [Pseudomonadota bacterium]|jgi:nitronate monooxygenase|nr:nitronate monooxygenase [Pseudomonas sp.]MDP9063171.1 nitronate monooxygenase [Pseudomonadota bacterium]MDQ3595964.1 nitronate monooxygenase [Pseudomonadota bacterium]
MPQPPLYTPLLDMLRCKYPILCMIDCHLVQAEFAATISNAGGLGCIKLGNKSGSEARQEIQAYRMLSREPFAVVLEPAATVRSHFNAQIEACVEAQIPIVMLPPGEWAAIERFKRAGVRVLQQIDQADQASFALAAGADVLVVVGGTHPVLESELFAFDSIPVIATSAICTGGAVAAALKRGAQGLLCYLATYAIGNFHVQDHYAKRVAQLVDDANARLKGTSIGPKWRSPFIHTKEGERLAR